MLGWNGFVGLLGFSLSTLANSYGGDLGLAIITLSIAVRFALLPLASVEPATIGIGALQALQRAWHKAGGGYESSGNAGTGSAWSGDLFCDPARTWIRRTISLDSQSGATQSSSYHRYRRSYLSCCAPGTHLPQQSCTAATVVPALLTLVFAWRLAAGVALYWAASTAVTGLQGFLLSRDKVA